MIIGSNWIRVRSEESFVPSHVTDLSICGEAAQSVATQRRVQEDGPDSHSVLVWPGGGHASSTR